MKNEVYDLYHLLPDSITRPIDCRRRRKHWRSSGTVFIHVPKAAGTSISHALYGRSLGHFKAREIKKWCPSEFASLVKFSFVRNPWDRAVSAYRFALKGNTETAGMRHKKKYNNSAFRSFEAFVNEWLGDKDLTQKDNVFQPQYLFVTDENNRLIVDYLGKVETFEEDLKSISKRIGISLKPMVLNQLSEKGSYTRFFTDSRLVNTVGDIFSRDVALFDYDFK